MLMTTTILTVLALFIAQPKPTTVADLASSTTTSVSRNSVVPATPKEQPTKPVKAVLPKEETIKKLIQAIKGLEFRSLKFRSGQRRKIAEAAYKVGHELRIDPFFFIALSRMESDFTGKPQYAPQCYLPRRMCFADCGITQHHVRGKRRYVFKFCKKLIKDHTSAMRHSGKELLRHIKYCKSMKHKKYHNPYIRCVLNRYNQGTFYKRMRGCDRMRRAFWMSKKYHRYIKRKCRHRAAYWRKLSCFYYGAKNVKQITRSCRYCFRPKQIPWRYYNLPKTTPYAIPTTISF